MDSFEDRTYYTISKYSLDNPEFSESEVTYLIHNACGDGELQFGNWYGESGYLEKPEPYTMSLYPESLLEEMICSSNWRNCVINTYTLDSGTLSEDKKEVKFNITSSEWNDSREFNVISITKM
ncbi:MAG: hypothetical protein ACR5LA_08585 [Wolbachia sp.]